MAGEELVGPLPTDWGYTTLGEVCARGGGEVQTGPFGSQLHAADYVSDGVPSIMPQNIGDNRVVRDGIARISAGDAQRLSRYLVRPGDIVYSRRGDVERRALIRDAEDGWLCGTGCLRVRFGGGYIDPTFASYYLGDARVREWVVRHAHGATMPNLNTGILSALPFVEPPPPEQRAIAHILGTLDDKIELNRRMSETLEAMARALFKSWFVDFDPVRAKAEGRLPAGRQATPPGAGAGIWFVYALECENGSVYIGHTEDVARRFDEHLSGKGAEWTKRHPPRRIAYWEELPTLNAATEREKKLKTGAGREWLKAEIAARDVVSGALPSSIADLFPPRLVDSELGEMPEGWKIGRFGDVVEQLRDQENPLSSPDSLFHHFSIPAFDEGQSPKPEYGESIKSLKSRVPVGVILLSKLNPEIERVWMVDVRPGERAVCSTEFLVLRALSPFTRSYVYCLTRSPLFRQQIEGLVTGTSKSHQRAQVDSILNLTVVVPLPSIVTAFDNSTDSLLARTLECRRESHILAALRDTLLPKLISGELRVKDAERFVGRAV